MRVVITGSAGLIGGIVHDHLRALGHEVIGIDRPHQAWLDAGRNTEDEMAPSRVAIEMELSTCSDEQLTSIFEGADALIHLAGDANPSNEDSSMLKNNIEVTTAIFRCALAAQLRRVIVASSGLAQVGLEALFSEGGPFHGTLIGVEHGVSPTSTYGVSKVYAELLAEMHARVHGMETIAVRIGTVIPNEDEHWIRGGRLQATAFLAEDVRRFFEAALSAPLNGHLLTAAQSDSPGRFLDLEPGMTTLGWSPIPWPDSAENLQ
ncbi:MAG: NAD(P)-dependent oxidoreductase [Candidatus Thermoplasmatota archaeon]|nr:NAD(P)-dependent oxidoreductase [Candidatus Thermoplasmatota archaeon]